MPDSQGESLPIVIGNRFEQANPVPGFPPDVITIVWVDGEWAWWQDWRERPARPVRVASLNKPSLWRRIAATGQYTRDVRSIAELEADHG